LITQAMNADVSDIHIEVRRDEAKVRFRKNGDLFDFIPWSVRYARVMAGVIYQVIADEKDTTFDEFKPQDAIIDRDLGDKGRIRIRLATIPAYPSGFDMIMRILKMGVSGKRRSLESLGYNKVQLSNTRRAVAKPVGAVVMAGTTGSGKSTSLNSMLSEKIEHYGGRIKVITVEDPPEYLLLNATQVPVVRSRSQAKAGDATVNPFASVVRAAMRSDPDILMVGEVRDPDSAELLIHAVQSGHQVFTTTHASSGIDVVSRLRSNHVPDDVLGSQNFLSALMYQTLLPSLCPHCSIGVADFAKSVNNEKDFEMLKRIFKYFKPKDASALRFKRDGGCPNCVDGVTGRSVAAEVILPDPHMLKCFRERRETLST
jgi:type II secretory ATPase GspE/PulE/Tfp pilus assembly ATPase PilB-like protein